MNRAQKITSTLLLSATVVGTALTGCSSDTAASEGEVTTINWWTRVGDHQAALAEKFNQSQDRIKVVTTQVPDDQYVNKVGTGIRSEDGPDLLDFDVANGPLFAATGILTDLSDRVEGIDYADQLNPGMVSLGEYEDATYSLPFTAGPSVMLYNKTLFEKAGLDPEAAPSTWAEIKSSAEAIRALGPDTYGIDIPGACGGCLSFAVQPLIWANGGETMSEASPDQETLYGTNPDVAGAFSFYHDLWDAGLASPAGQTEAGATWGQDFEAGKVGIILAGTWMKPAAEEAGFEIGVAPIPGEDGNYSTFAGGDNIGIASSSDAPDAAWEFTQWLHENEQQTTIADSGLVPVRADVVTDEFATQYPDLALQVEISDESNAPNSIATNSLQLSASSPWLAAFQSIVFDGKKPSEVLPTADTESRKLIEQAYEQVDQ
jgi:multiple sugar transport system substrate-binding protein